MKIRKKNEQTAQKRRIEIDTIDEMTKRHAKTLACFSVYASMKIRIGNVTESVTDNASGNEKEPETAAVFSRSEL